MYGKVVTVDRSLATKSPRRDKRPNENNWVWTLALFLARQLSSHSTDDGSSGWRSKKVGGNSFIFGEEWRFPGLEVEWRSWRQEKKEKKSIFSFFSAKWFRPTLSGFNFSQSLSSPIQTDTDADADAIQGDTSRSVTSTLISSSKIGQDSTKSRFLETYKSVVFNRPVTFDTF